MQAHANTDDIGRLLWKRQRAGAQTASCTGAAVGNQVCRVRADPAAAAETGVSRSVRVDVEPAAAAELAW